MRTLFLGWSVVMMAFPAQSGAEVVWVDANGITIAPVVGEPFARPSVLLAPDGLIWSWIPETATVLPPAFGPGIVFADPECTEPAGANPNPPRYVFRIPGNGLPPCPFTHGCAWARADDAATEVIPVAYFRNGTVCQRTGPVGVIPLSKLIAVDPTPLDLGARPPLHLERR